MSTKRGHRQQSVVVNGSHIWECRDCGDRWHPSDEPKRDCPEARFRSH